MRITRMGRLPEDKEYSFVCAKCDTIAEAKKSEGRLVYDNRDGNALVFICPLCKCEVWVSA